MSVCLCVFRCTGSCGELACRGEGELRADGQLVVDVAPRNRPDRSAGCGRIRRQDVDMTVTIRMVEVKNMMVGRLAMMETTADSANENDRCDDTFSEQKPLGILHQTDIACLQHCKAHTTPFVI